MNRRDPPSPSLQGMEASPLASPRLSRPRQPTAPAAARSPPSLGLTLRRERNEKHFIVLKNSPRGSHTPSCLGKGPGCPLTPGPRRSVGR